MRWRGFHLLSVVSRHGSRQEIGLWWEVQMLMRVCLPWTRIASSRLTRALTIKTSHYASFVMSSASSHSVRSKEHWGRVITTTCHGMSSYSASSDPESSDFPFRSSFSPSRLLPLYSVLHACVLIPFHPIFSPSQISLPNNTKILLARPLQGPTCRVTFLPSPQWNFQESVFDCGFQWYSCGYEDTEIPVSWFKWSGVFFGCEVWVWSLELQI